MFPLNIQWCHPELRFALPMKNHRLIIIINFTLRMQLATCSDPPLHVNCNECISDWLHSVTKKIEMSPDLLKCFFPKESPRIGDDFGQTYRKRNSSGVIQILQISFIGLPTNWGKYHHLKQCGIHFTDIYIHHRTSVSWLENCAVLMTNIWT